MNMDSPLKHHIQFAALDDGIVVLRIVGKGDYEISGQLRAISDRYSSHGPCPRYIVDLGNCPSLDSTFMGEIASMALYQRSHRADQLVVVNANANTRCQMGKLGLKHILDLRQDSLPEGVCDGAVFQSSAPRPLSRFEQIIHMIECHQALIEADSGNEVRFRGVLQSLQDSLARESAKRKL